MHSRRDLRILHVCNALRIGGLETWLLRVAAAAATNGMTFDVAVNGKRSHSLEATFRTLGANIIRIHAGKYGIRRVHELTRVLASADYDVVHTHVPSTCGRDVTAAHRAGIASVFTAHSTRFLGQTWFTQMPFVRNIRRCLITASIRRAVDGATIATAVSHGARAALERIAVPSRPVSVLPLGVDTPSICRTTARLHIASEFGFPPSSPVVVHVGRFIPAKNHRGLIRILANVSRRIPAARFLLVGDGAMREHMTKYAEAMALTSRVVFPGNRDDVPLLLAGSDLFLFPSHYEGFPVACLEAGAAGLPIVASAIPGVDEIVTDGVAGRLFSIDDEQGMAEAVVAILSRPDLRTRYGETVRQKIATHWSVGASVAALRNTYDSALATRTAGIHTTAA